MTEPVSAIARRRWIGRHLHLAPLQFTLDGSVITLLDVPARGWLAALLSDDPVDLLLNLLAPPVAAELWEDVLDIDHPLDGAMLGRIGREMVRQATGRTWGEVVQLVAQLIHSWPTLDGRAADRGTDPLEWSLERLCNWVYFTMVEHADKKAREDIDSKLATPQSVDIEDDAVDESEDDAVSQQWLAMAAAGQVGALPQDGTA